MFHPKTVRFWNKFLFLGELFLEVLYMASYCYRCECCYCLAYRLAEWYKQQSRSVFTFWNTDHFLHFLCPCGALELRDDLVFTSEIRPYLLTVSRNQGDWSQSSLCRQCALCVCACFPCPPKPLPLLLMWCQSHGFQAPRAVNQNQILFLTTLNPPPLALALSTSISPWTLCTTYLRSDQICSIICWLQEGQCLARKPSSHYKHVFLVLASFQSSSVPQRD